MYASSSIHHEHVSRNRIDVNYEWNYEKHQDISWDPVPLKFLVAKENEKAASLDITVSSGFDLTAKSYAKLPFCIGGDHPGRWINVTDGILPPNDPHGDSLTHYKDEEGRIWLPYNCRYRPLSYSYFSRCLAKHHPSLHIWADSHMRRSLKAISTGGAWCNTWYDPDSSECKCYDWNLQVPFMNMSNVVDFFPQIGGNNGAKVFYYTWQGLLPWGPNWRADMERPQLEALTAPLSEKTGLDMSQPSVLILSMSKYINGKTMAVDLTKYSQLGCGLWNVCHG